MISLPVGGGGGREEEEDDGEEEEDDEEEEHINIETNIPSKMKPEPVEIVEEPTNEQEATIEGYFAAPQDEQAEEIKILRNKNQ